MGIVRWVTLLVDFGISSCSVIESRNANKEELSNEFSLVGVSSIEISQSFDATLSDSAPFRRMYPFIMHPTSIEL